MSDLHISAQLVKILDDETVVDVKGEHQLLELMALNGCVLGSSSGAKLRGKMLLKPKHLDTEEVVSKVKELLEIQEHSKELGGVIRNPEPTHKPSWGGAPRHSRRVDFSEDEEEDKFWSSSKEQDHLPIGKADKIPSQDGNPPAGLAGRLSPHPPD